MTDEELTQAIAELQEVVRCRCDEAYRDRGLKDPQCECDSAEAVKIVARRIEALTEQLAAAQHDAKEAEAYAEEVERELRDTQDRANAFATKEYYAKMRAERAEAKLAKAAAALEFYTGYDDGPIARAALNEIKGESHE